MTSFKRNLPQGRGSFIGENSYTATNESFVQRAALLPAYGGVGLKMTSLATGTLTAGNIFANNLRMVLCDPIPTTTLITAATWYITTLIANSTTNVGIYQVVENAQRTAADFILVPGSQATVSAATTGQKIFRYQTPVQLEPQNQYFYGVLSLGGNPSYTLVPAVGANPRPIRIALNQTSSTTTSLPTSISTADSNWSTATTLGFPVVVFLTKQYEFLL